MDSVILNYINGLGNWLYLLVFVGMILEGNITMLIVGFLLKTGEGNLYFFLLFAAFFGELTESLLWYWVGTKIKNHGSKIASWVVVKTGHFDEHFINRPKTALLISKFIYGLYRAAAIRVGILENDIKKYLKQIIPIIILWMAVIGSVGFALGAAFSLMEKYLRYAELILLILFVLIILVQRLIIPKKLEN